MPPIPPHKAGQEPRGPATHSRGAWARCRCCPLGPACCRRVGPSPEAVAVLVVVADLEQGQGAGKKCQHPRELLPPAPAPMDIIARSPQIPMPAPLPLHFLAPSVSKSEVFLHCPSSKSVMRRNQSVQQKDTGWQLGDWDFAFRTCGSQKRQPASGYYHEKKQPKESRTGWQIN